MNKSFKSVLNRSTGTYVAASENVKSSGKPAKSKLAMKVASASLAVSASIAMLSSGHAVADESVPESGYLVATTDSAIEGLEETPAAQIGDEQVTNDSAQGAQQVPVRGRMLGAQQGLLGASQNLDPVTYTLMATADHSLWSRSGTYGDAAPAYMEGAPINNSIAIGGGTILSGTGDTVLGVQASTIGARNAQSVNATAIGYQATAGSFSAALGYQSFADYSSVAVGESSSATGLVSVAIGDSAGKIGSGTYSVALGQRANATATNSVALGQKANATASDAVALGSASLADRDNTVSVGASGSERQIVNVAAGTNATDAVNYGQLQAAGLKVDTNGATTNAFVAYDATTESTITLGGGTAGTKITNLAPGDVSSATSTDAVNGSQLYATNQNVTQNTADIAANTSSIGTLNTAMATAVQYDTTTKDKVTLGGGAAGTTITNVKAGDLSATSTDAVNGSQLYPMSQKLQSVSFSAQSPSLNSSSSGLLRNAAASAVGMNSIAIGGGALASMADTVVIGGGAYGSDQSTALGSSANAGASSATSIGYGASYGTVGTYSSSLGWMAKAQAANSSALGATSTASATRSVALGYGSVADVANTVSVGTTSATRKIVNVTVGDISSSTSTDAVNGSQLYATNQSVAANATAIAANTSDIATNAAAIATNTSEIAANTSNISTLNTQIADAVKYDGTAHDTITLGGATGTKITNVAAGDITSATSTDAVNGSQLYATNQSVAANATAIATNASDIATNAAAIATNTSDIAQNTSDISTINTQVGTLNTQIADAVKYDGTAHDTITLDGAAGTKITNVAAGDISSATSTDAVNGAQLYATNQNVAANTTAIAANTSDIATNATAIATNTTDIAQNTSEIAANTSNISTLNTQVADAVKYDGTAHDTITLDGATGTKITNVAAGDITSASSTDAVNGSQLYATNQSVAANATAIAANTSDIATNATAIATNTSDIAANTSDIAQNTSDISTINTQVGTLNTQIADAVKYDGTAHDTITLDGASGTKIKNVAAGDISSATSTDAVNGSQLYAMNQNVAANTTAIAANTSDIATNAAAIATNTSDIGQNTSDISTINAQVGTLNTQIADAVKYDGTAHDTITLDGAAGTKITNVAAGDITSATSTDAVNGAQLYATNQNVAANTTAIAANTSDIATNTTAIATNAGNIATNTSDIAQNTSDISTINTQVGTLNTQIADAVKYDGTTHDTITLGGTAGTKITNVAAGDISSTASTDAVNGSQLYTTNQNVAANTTAIATNTSDIATNAADIATNTSDIAQNTTDISTINTQVGTLNTQIADAVKYDGTAHDTITLGGTTGTKITNVAAGDITSATSTDAVNGSQLYTTNQNVAANTTAIASNTSDIAQNTSDIATNTSNISKLNTQMADAVKYDDTEHGSMTLGGSAGTVIKNVAAGQMTADSTEAVNGSQLFAVEQSISDQSASLADSVRYDSSSHDKITLGTSGTPVALTNVKAGDVSASSLDAVNGSQLYAVTQDVTQNTTDIAGLTASMNDLSGGTTGLVRQDATTLALSVGANTGGGTVSFAGLDGARVLTGVANGAVNSTSSEAINGSQLFHASASTAAALGGGASVDANGGVTAPSYTVGGKQVSDVGSAVSNLDDRVTQNSADIATVKGGLADVSKTAANAVAYDSADHDKVTLGGTDASAAVQMTNVAAGDLSATSTDAVNGSQLGATNARVAATESAIANFEAAGTAGLSGTGDGSAAMGTNSDASGANSTAAGANSNASGDDSTATGAYATASGNNATAAGAHSRASGDGSAAFGGNAAASGTNAIAIGGNSQASGNGSIALGGNSSATADNSVALGANSVADEANTVSVGSAGNERRVTNVAPGVNGTDATNVNQLNALRNDVSSSMTSLQRAAFGGVAAAMAMPSLMPSSPGKTIVGAGVANYKGYNAIAAGATYRSENNRWLVNGAVSVTQSGDTGVRAQAGYEF